MTFEEWWATLTPAEHKVIGVNNAKFVWNAAVDACIAEVGESEVPQIVYYPDDQYAVKPSQIPAVRRDQIDRSIDLLRRRVRA